jgi:hypothetical protein
MYKVIYIKTVIYYSIAKQSLQHALDSRFQNGGKGNN